MTNAPTWISPDAWAIVLGCITVVLIAANEFHLCRLRRLHRSMMHLANTVLDEIHRSDGHRQSAMKKLEEIQRQFDIVKGRPHG